MSSLVTIYKHFLIPHLLPPSPPQHKVSILMSWIAAHQELVHPKNIPVFSLSWT